jgi:hypothetical protein
MNKRMLGIVGYRSKIAEVTRVRKLVEIDDTLITFLEPIDNKVCADEACSTGD